MLEKLDLQALYDDWFWYLAGLGDVKSCIDANRVNEVDLREAHTKTTRKLDRVNRRLNEGNLDVFDIDQRQRDILERRLQDIEQARLILDNPELDVASGSDGRKILGSYHLLEFSIRDAEVGRLELGSLLGSQPAKYLGDGRIQLPSTNEPLMVNQRFIRILECLIERRVMRTAELENEGFTNPSQDMGHLLKDYPALEGYITRPGKSNKGRGYSTKIIDII